MQLHSLADRSLFSSGDICAGRFGGTFDGFGGYIETGE